MSETLRIIPLGGLGEVGKNMTVYELGDDIIVVDAGLAFPRDEHLGVDLVLPDFSYLEGKRVRAIVLTHGHEDHVGALPYVLREIDVDEVIATRLTLGLVRSKLEEHGVADAAELREADPEGEPIEIGRFRLEFVRVAHSIPDCVAIVIETPAGRVVHTGDWKLDHTPVDGLRTDVGRLAEIGNRGVDLMLGDSTNAERPGMTGSERLVGEAFRTLMPVRKGRILVASFASNIHRMQQAAHAQLARDAGVPADVIVIAENGSVVELSSRGARIVDRIAAGVTFVDGLGVGDVQDVALRDRRRLSEVGVLIVVTTVALSDGVEIAPPELIARGMGEDDELLAELRAEAQRVVADLAADGITEIKLLQEHLHDEVAKVVYARTRRRPMILPIVIEV